MTYCALFNILAALAVAFGVYFAYSTARQEDRRIEWGEFAKILGFFTLCALFLGLFVDVFFLVTRFFLWLLLLSMDFLMNQIFSRRTGLILSLLAVNALGGYLCWEMWKEKKVKEDSEFMASTSGASSKPQEEESPAAEAKKEPAAEIREGEGGKEEGNG